MVATRVGSVEEVAGEAAALVPAGDVTSLATAIERVLTDDALRDSMRAAGLREAARYSWDEVARSTLRVYREVLAG